MEQRRLGRTGLQVSVLGFGAWEIGWTPLDEGQQVGRLLNYALDNGINFVDRNLSTRMRRSVVVISEHVAVCGAC
jgi:predicted aldo/keto reductase-like oxidoreductase